MKPVLHMEPTPRLPEQTLRLDFVYSKAFCKVGNCDLPVFCPLGNKRPGFTRSKCALLFVTIMLLILRQDRRLPSTIIRLRFRIILETPLPLIPHGACLRVEIVVTVAEAEGS